MILHNDELHVHHSKKSIRVSPRTETRIVSRTSNDLETCLTKLKLDNKEQKVPPRAISCEPTFICNPICKIITRPNYSLSRSYFYVNNLHNECTQGTNETENHQPPDAFTDRILQWLNSSSTSVDIVTCSEDTIKITERKPPLKERPKTSPGGNGIQKVPLVQEDQYEQECSSIHYGRPQLHVFVPIFEPEGTQNVKKSKSFDDVQ